MRSIVPTASLFGCFALGLATAGCLGAPDSSTGESAAERRTETETETSSEAIDDVLQTTPEVTVERRAAPTAAPAFAFPVHFPHGYGAALVLGYDPYGYALGYGYGGCPGPCW
jgi:hypothetical protein